LPATVISSKTDEAIGRKLHEISALFADTFDVKPYWREWSAEANSHWDSYRFLSIFRFKIDTDRKKKG